jgi:hypothetical protein
MTRLARFVYPPLCLSGVIMAAVSGLPIPQAQARPLPANSKNHTVLCTCGNLTFTNSNVLGNVSIANDGAFIGRGPGSITGTVQFSAPNTGQYSPGNVVVTGGGAFGNEFVETDINSFNAESQTLADLSGAPLTLTAGGSVNASTGILDSVSGNEVFTATIDPSFVAGTTFTINGDGTGNQTVVVNIGDTGTGSVKFDGSIILTGGLTADQVLFNFDSGDYATNTGGDTLTIDNMVTPDPPTMGIYFNPNGAIDIVNSDIVGRVFGGPTDFQIIGSDIGEPTVPEPTTLNVLGAAFVAFLTIRRRYRSLTRL